MNQLIWRHLSSGTVAHAFYDARDDKAVCGRLVLYVLGQWLDGKGDKRECKSCRSAPGLQP